MRAQPASLATPERQLHLQVLCSEHLAWAMYRADSFRCHGCPTELVLEALFLFLLSLGRISVPHPLWSKPWPWNFLWPRNRSQKCTTSGWKHWATLRDSPASLFTYWTIMILRWSLHQARWRRWGKSPATTNWVFVFPPIHMLTPNPQCAGTWGWGFWEEIGSQSWSPHGWDSAFMTVSRELRHSFHHRRTRQKEDCL